MDKKFMELALKEAKKAFLAGEVPVGAVIVKDGKVISRARNMREVKQNAICHAEILAIDKACKRLKSFRLDGCELYVTLEPCPMCAGAISGARISTIIFGLEDKKYGCAGSKHNFFEDEDFEHKADVVGGVLKKECEQILQNFFALARERNKLTKLIGKKVAEIHLQPNEENLCTNSPQNVDKIKKRKLDILQHCRHCVVDNASYNCVIKEEVKNPVVLAIVRGKSIDKNVLIVGKQIDEQNIIDFAKRTFCSGDKLVTKDGKYIL
ncbi:MAG: nucleoside deaminase [Christensenellales bacterium]